MLLHTGKRDHSGIDSTDNQVDHDGWPMDTGSVEENQDEIDDMWIQIGGCQQSTTSITWTLDWWQQQFGWSRPPPLLFSSRLVASNSPLWLVTPHWQCCVGDCWRWDSCIWIKMMEDLDQGVRNKARIIFLGARPDEAQDNTDQPLGAHLTAFDFSLYTLFT